MSDLFYVRLSHLILFSSNF